MLNPVDSFLLLGIKFRFGIRLLFFKELWPTFQPLKTTFGRNRKTDILCRRCKTVFYLMYNSYIRFFRKTPDGCKIGAPQKVIYQCSEDGVSDTIKPRLERCGADCRKIAFINEEVYNGLTLDDERIRQAIIEFRPRLVVIDPIQAYLGSDSDLQIAGRARKLMRLSA